MKQQFVETIKIKDGKVVNLSCHQVRMERTINHFFPDLAQRAMPCQKELIKPRKDMDFVKARVVYGMQGVELIEYIPYSIRNIKSLQILYNDSIEYEYKSTDRSALNKLVADKGACDEIIIVKNGYITDTSFTNLAIFDSGDPNVRCACRNTLDLSAACNRSHCGARRIITAPIQRPAGGADHYGLHSLRAVRSKRHRGRVNRK